ncbi:MAG: threonine--tRNA ligase, partial [Mollicutes bacterium]|nr:threonine--tRNA ligase [Mollicutes bacterium]
NIDAREEKLSYKIRESQTKKVPLTIILGDREKESKVITYRPFGKEESYTLEIYEFISKVKENISNKALKF